MNPSPLKKLIYIIMNYTNLKTSALINPQPRRGLQSKQCGGACVKFLTKPTKAARECYERAGIKII